MSVRFFKRLDDAVYRVERAICVVLLIAMAIAVFLDAVHRQASTEGRVEQLVAALVPQDWVSPVTTAFISLVAWVVLYGAARTARREPRHSPKRSALFASAALVIGYWGLRALVFLAPNGLIWAQSFGLCGMLWVGFLGASMATREGNHLTLEIMEFVWRGRAKRAVGRLGAVSAALFCLLLAYLSALQVRFEYLDWAESDGAVGTFSVFEVPRFAVFLILPISLSVMSARFLGRAFSGREPDPAAVTPLAGEEAR